MIDAAAKQRQVTSTDLIITQNHHPQLSADYLVFSEVKQRKIPKIQYHRFAY